MKKKIIIIQFICIKVAALKNEFANVRISKLSYL